MKIAVDIMGFENDVNDAVKACIDFKKKFSDLQIILVGDVDKVKINLPSGVTIIDTKEFIAMDENPLNVRHKKNSSMYKAIELVKNNEADGVLSAGSTPCYVALTYMLLGKINNVSKPGFMPYVPSRKGNGFNFIDVGANKECNGKDLLDFAIMADIYVKNVRKIAKPKIGILNIGTEENKGLEYHQEAHKLLLQQKDLNYIGFVESRTLFEGEVDILVSDGFTGNLVLKALEGTAKSVTGALKDEYKKPLGWLGFLFSIIPLLKLKKKFDYKNNAGAFVIGLNKIAVKTHGSADYEQFSSSLRMLKEVIDFNVIEDIKKRLNDE